MICIVSKLNNNYINSLCDSDNTEQHTSHRKEYNL